MSQVTITSNEASRAAKALVESGKNWQYYDRKDFARNAMANSALYREVRTAVLEMCNTNTVDTDLKRIALRQEMIEEFAIALAPLTAFCTTFNAEPLEGTDTVGVAFYPLQTAAAQSWDPATGYATAANSSTEIRKIAVGGSGADSGSNAAANTCKDRLYLMLPFSSYELRRQPFLNVLALSKQNAAKLGVDIFKQVVSRCVTAASFGAPVKTSPSVTFASADIADLYGTATGLSWPMRNRSLTLDHTYNVSLIKDNTFKQYLSYASTDPLRKAFVQQAYGFEDINVIPNLTNYSPAGENLAGWIAHASGLLVATSPIMPSEEVRKILSHYDVVTDPKTGISFEYRQFGNAVLDTSYATVECSFGAAVGRASALKRIVSA